MTLTDKELSIEEYGKRSLLRPAQRQELERSVADIRERLSNPVVLELTGGDPATLEKQLAREEQMLVQGSPPTLTQSQATKMIAKLKKCEALITNGMPTFSMMERGRPSDVDHHVAHENARWQDEDGQYTTKRAILARQNYLLTLAPSSLEPNLLSVATLRTDTVRGDPAKFRTNWDAVRWRETMEDEMQAAIDDEKYLLFCGLKAMQWADVTIRQKLDWDLATFDRAMERWREDPEMHPQGTNAPSTPNGQRTDTDALPLVSPDPGGVPAVPFVERIQAPEGWPRKELETLGVSQYKFLKQCQFSHASFSRWSESGQWPPERYETAMAALAELRRSQALEPEPSEPSVV